MNCSQDNKFPVVGFAAPINLDIHGSLSFIASTIFFMGDSIMPPNPFSTCIPICVIMEIQLNVPFAIETTVSNAIARAQPIVGTAPSMVLMAVIRYLPKVLDQKLFLMST